MSCNCNCEPNPCTCEDQIFETDECIEASIKMKCTYYSGEDIVCLDILNLDDGEVVLHKLADELCIHKTAITTLTTNYANIPTDDKFVKVSATDTTHGYLVSKVVPGSHITITTGNPSANENLNVSVNMTTLTPVIQTLVNTSISAYTQTPLSTVDTTTIHFGSSGTNQHTLTGNVILTGLVGSTSGNLITVSGNGLHVANKIIGTLNYIPKFTTDGTTLGNSNIIDNGTSVVTIVPVGIGGSAETGLSLKVTGDLKYSGRAISTPQILTYNTTVLMNLTAGTNASLVLTGNAILSITNAVAGLYGTIVVKQDGTGNRHLTLPQNSRVVNNSNGQVVLTTIPNAHDLLSFYYDGTTFFWTYGLNYN